MDRDVVDEAFQNAQRLHLEGRLRLAETEYRRVLQMDQHHAGAFHLLGLLALQCEKPAIAVELMERATRLQPADPDLWNNLGVSYQKLGRTSDAIPAHRRSIELSPENAEFHNNLGKDLAEAARYSEAIAAFTRAIELRPVHADTHLNLSHALYRLGRHQEALDAAQLAVSQRPDWHQARYNLGSLLLLHGRLEEGFKLHESRFEAGLSRSICVGPVWDGSPLNNQSILLHAEQGFGDTIQFCRYAAKVRALGGKVTLACQPELVRLMRSLGDVDDIIPALQSMSAERHCPLMSLPALLGTGLGSIPSNVPYLRADAALVGRWKQRIPTDGRLKVGLAWSGRPADRDYIDRSIPLTALARLFQNHGTWFCSLQKNSAVVTTEGSTVPVKDWSSEICDFADTAALIENVDLVISIDTAAAHLAGAMGKDVWLLLPYVSDYRWLLNRNDSPWYPTMTIFRQTAMNDWDEPVSRVATRLGRQIRG